MENNRDIGPEDQEKVEINEDIGEKNRSPIEKIKRFKEYAILAQSISIFLFVIYTILWIESIFSLFTTQIVVFVTFIVPFLFDSIIKYIIKPRRMRLREEHNSKTTRTGSKKVIKIIKSALEFIIICGLLVA
ncbi:MAG: hypothetical protein GF364_15440, partial [Candidatus Lokiarchaeota archaeon]|nr:hypothetical protein [Candidatus Lokiarchaeota archaeon]